VSNEEVASCVLDNVMQCLDSNNDGHISFEEFKEGFEVRERLFGGGGEEVKGLGGR
jgi:Ca2+-binding EF-hand superfamily protein